MTGLKFATSLAEAFSTFLTGSTATTRNLRLLQRLTNCLTENNGRKITDQLCYDSHCRVQQIRCMQTQNQQPANKIVPTIDFNSSATINAKNTMLQHREFNVPAPWGDIACQEWIAKLKDDNSSAKKCCLLLHGWQDNSNSFAPLVQYLPEDYIYVGVDLSGHGLSSPKGAGTVYNLADYTVDVRMILNYLRWTKYAIIGHSMGGAIAQVYGALYQDEIEHIVSIDIIKPLSSREETIVSSMRRAVDSYAGWKPAEKQPGDSQKRMFTYKESFDFYYAATKRLISPESVKLLLDRNLMQVGEKDGEQLFTFRRDKRIQFPGTFRYSDEQMKWLMKDVTFPLFIIRAKDRAPFEPQEDEFLEYYKATLKKLLFYRRVDGHHHLHMDNPKICGALIEKFLQNELENE